MKNKILLTKTTATLLRRATRQASHRLSILSVVATACLQTASAQTWDKTTANNYVAFGFETDCTAFAHGRFKSLNGEWLRCRDTSGNSVSPNAMRMYDFSQETATAYRDTVPVTGGLVVWTGPNGESDPGHAGIIESIKIDGSVKVSEQNWPIGSSPTYKDLSAAKLRNRDSTNTKGVTKYYKLRGFVNPNRPPAIGTLATQSLGNQILLDVPLIDEDGRNLRIQAGIVDGQTAVAGTSWSSIVSANRTTRCVFPTSSLRRGKTYTLTIWVWDFKDLRSTKSTAFKW